MLELVHRSGDPQYDRARYQVGYAVVDIESAYNELIARGMDQVTGFEGDAVGGRW